MNKRTDIFKQMVSVFFCTLMMVIVINYFGSLFMYNEVRISIAVDILFALITAIVSGFRGMQKRIEEMEERIKKLEYRISRSI